jgi:hypothetical protein
MKFKMHYEKEKQKKGAAGRLRLEDFCLPKQSQAEFAGLKCCSHEPRLRPDQPFYSACAERRAMLY